MLEESVQNVFEMYRQDAEKGKAQFMKTLKTLFDEVHEVINEAFSEIKEMNKATHDMLIDDFDELLVAYFRLKLVFPRDYYAMQVRGPEEFYDSEKDQNFDVVLDFPMYIPEGGLTDIALETYFVEFSDEAKIMIFKSVTDELENPIFTLKTYLRKK